MSKGQRPLSAQSRNAWTIDQPAAMESEDYNAIDVHKEMEQQQAAAIASEPAKTSCWFKTKKFIRSLWATRMTENTADNPELHVRTTLRELFIYLVFLLILCVLTFGMSSPNMYYYTKVMSELFLDAQFKETDSSFRGMTTLTDFWRFAEGPLVDGLYWENYYNGQSVPQNSSGYIYHENKMLGVPRVRQLKVRNDSCTVHDDFANEIKHCYDSYAQSIEDTESFGPYLTSNNSAWYYQSEKDIDGSTHWGLISTYGGGGFIQNLGATKNVSVQIVKELRSNLWLDRGTRAVLIDFTVYNANLNLFCVVRLVVEFPATGGAIPSYSFRTVKLIRYVTGLDYFVLCCEGIFVLFILYYIVEEILEIKKHRLGYFKSFWNILDIIILLVAICCLAFNVFRSFSVTNMLETLLMEPHSFPDFEFLSFWQMIFNNGVAIMVFFAWIKLFKYISFNKTMTQLSSTLARCAKDLAGFAVMFFIIFLAFAQLGYLIFGTQVKDFSSFQDAIYTLFRIILGDFNFHELEEANRILGPAYFVLYVFFVFFVLLNMFLAIINDTYAEVKADIANQESEFEVGDYFRKGYNKLAAKLNLKKDKIAGIQSALEAADSNNDNLIDFEEWREQMKGKGYTDNEIETVFAQYDTDGDRVLDAEEQKKMLADLESQRAKLNKEFEELDAGRKAEDDEDDSDLDEEEAAMRAKRRGAVGGVIVAKEEFAVLTRRVDRMEHSIGSIVSKIDAVLIKLEAMERAKSKRRETMTKILDSITESDGATEEQKREQMEKLVKGELEKWDAESSRGSTPAGSRSVSRQSRR